MMKEKRKGMLQRGIMVAVSMEAAAEVESLYKNVGNGEDKSLCLMDKIEDHRERQEELINHMVLEKLISQLGEKDREIIIRRYFRNQTQTQVAISLGISQVQVSRLEKETTVPEETAEVPETKNDVEESK